MNFVNLTRKASLFFANHLRLYKIERVSRFFEKHYSGPRRIAVGKEIQLDLDLDEYIDFRIFMEGDYERSMRAEFFRSLKSHKIDYFFDIGANIGLYSLFAAKEFKNTEVFSFEPDPVTQGRLETNIKLNNMQEKIQIYPLALSDQEGLSSFYRTKNKRQFDLGRVNSGVNSLVENTARHDEKISVDCRKLDSLFDLVGKSLALKIDVEGHEYKVLNGAKRLLANNRVCLLVESNSDIEAVKSLLSKIGFELKRSFSGSNYYFESGMKN